MSCGSNYLARRPRTRQGAGVRLARKQLQSLAGHFAKFVTMVCTLIESAKNTRCFVSPAHLGALVRDGAWFEKGTLKCILEPAKLASRAWLHRARADAPTLNTSGNSDCLSKVLSVEVFNLQPRLKNALLF